jgi:aryl-alcohol dehydrogenase-like predicted oxidoreductase
LIDTAAEYGFGLSEVIVGKALQGLRRNEIFLATKGGRITSPNGLPQPDQRPVSILHQLDESLRRLGTDWIDLYQLHGPAVETGVPVEESWAAMAILKQQGKVRYIGLCDFDANVLARCEKIHHVDFAQTPYNLLRRGAEADIFRGCLRHDVGIIVYSPLHFGLLSGSFVFSALANADWRRRSSWFSEPELSKNLALVECLRVIAARHGKTVGQMAIAWTLANPAVNAAVVGVRRPSQAEQNLGAMVWHLSDVDLAEIEAVFRVLN